MKKAIVIIDVPDYLDIKQCKVKCEILNKVSTRNYIGYLDLKPMPQKKHSNGSCKINATEWFFDSDYDDGWNDCIDEILGE